MISTALWASSHRYRLGWADGRCTMADGPEIRDTVVWGPEGCDDLLQAGGIHFPVYVCRNTPCLVLRQCCDIPSIHVSFVSVLSLFCIVQYMLHWNINFKWNTHSYTCHYDHNKHTLTHHPSLNPLWMSLSPATRADDASLSRQRRSLGAQTQLQTHLVPPSRCSSCPRPLLVLSWSDIFACDVIKIGFKLELWCGRNGLKKLSSYVCVYAECATFLKSSPLTLSGPQEKLACCR